ncbi:HlyD family efflux transporter periplasmic adaptor subunit [Pantoea ananatis]|nr:HlyD family efflux transporter periplasmic adaptor subunit [Pantoea ananatis]QKV86129.1 HlyD family efflux transporter periplasmic adaptor subunit [Pantoea ananatis]
MAGVLAPCDGIIQQASVQQGNAVRAGQRVAVIVEDNV